jgi:hypothetical protein
VPFFQYTAVFKPLLTVVPAAKTSTAAGVFADELPQEDKKTGAQNKHARDRKCWIFTFGLDSQTVSSVR